jgi:hypothetical protein
MRVVFFVAKTGKPSGGPPAGTSSPVCPLTGGVAGGVGSASSPPPQPARTSVMDATKQSLRTSSQSSGGRVMAR